MQDPAKMAALMAPAAEVAAYAPGREWQSIPQRELDTNPLLQQNPAYS